MNPHELYIIKVYILHICRILEISWHFSLINYNDQPAEIYKILIELNTIINNFNDNTTYI